MDVVDQASDGHCLWLRRNGLLRLRRLAHLPTISRTPAKACQLVGIICAMLATTVIMQVAMIVFLRPSVSFIILLKLST